MTPSHDDKLVNEICEKHIQGLFPPDAKVRNCDLTMSTEDVRGTLNSVIREAIAETRKQTLEEAAKLADKQAARCCDHGTDHFCEFFGCGNFDKLAAAIRLLSSPASTNSIHATLVTTPEKENK